MRTACAAVMIVWVMATGYGAQLASGGIPPCPAGADKNLQSSEARGCWFKAAHGAWRVLSRDGHYNTAVYHVAADNQADASEIARAIVAGDGQPISELLLYIYSEPLTKSARTRRVSWDARHGYVTLDFDGRVPRWLMPAQP